jgi:tetratricopeptide (TPR) repeat protein
VRRLLADLFRPRRATDDEWAQRGQAHLEAEEFAPALACFGKARQLDPANVEHLAGFAAALGGAGRPLEALVHADMALRIDERCAPAWAARGMSLVALERFEEARTALSSALRHDPAGQAPLFFTKALVEAKLGVWTLAFDSLVAHGRLNGKKAPTPELVDFVETVGHNAGVQAGQHLLGGAQAALEEAVRFLAAGELESALLGYDRAIAVDARFHGTWSGRGNVLRQLGRLGEALASFDRALDLNPAAGHAWFHRALALDAAGAHDEATISLARFLAVVPPKEMLAAVEYAQRRLGRGQDRDHV